jgi:hypothetical protein
LPKNAPSLAEDAVETAPNSRKSMRQNALTFPILSDAGGEVATGFGLRFKLPDYLIDLHKSLKDDLPLFNADPSWTLPMPPVRDRDRRRNRLRRGEPRLHQTARPLRAAPRARPPREPARR